jgi:hypothetical protein
MHNTLRLLQPIPLLQLTALLQAIQLVDILQPLMAGRAMATAQDHPTSCAKLSGRARLVTVAPTLSPMPNGKPLSSASGTAESASSAIAFRRTDYWLKPRRNARRARPAMRAFAKSWRRQVKKSPGTSGLSFHSLCIGGHRTRRQVRRWSVGSRRSSGEGALWQVSARRAPTPGGSGRLRDLRLA